MMELILPSRRLCHTWLKLATLFALAALGVVLVSLGGCSSTPRQQFRVAAVTYDATAIGLAVGKPKIDAATWQKIQDSEALARQRLATARQWLADNAALADVPGSPYPPLDPLNITLDILSGYLANVQLVDPTTPAATRPGGP